MQSHGSLVTEHDHLIAGFYDVPSAGSSLSDHVGHGRVLINVLTPTPDDAAIVCLLGSIEPLAQPAFIDSTILFSADRLVT